MKKCPYCAEEIQDEAIICRFCNRELQPVVAAPVFAAPVKAVNNGSVMIVVAGVGLIFGALLPWYSISVGIDKVFTYGYKEYPGNVTAVVGLLLMVAGSYGRKAPSRGIGVISTLLGIFAACLGIAKILDLSSTLTASYVKISIGAGVYITVIAGITSIVGGIVKMFQVTNKGILSFFTFRHSD